MSSGGGRCGRLLRRGSIIRRRGGSRGGGSRGGLVGAVSRGFALHCFRYIGALYLAALRSGIDRLTLLHSRLRIRIRRGRVLSEPGWVRDEGVKRFGNASVLRGCRLLVLRLLSVLAAVLVLRWAPLWHGGL